MKSMKINLPVYSFLLLYSLLLVMACEPDIFQPNCEGGYSVDVYREDAVTGSQTKVTNLNNNIFVGQNLVFQTTYSGPGEVCWTVEGPCVFETSSARIRLEPGSCEGSYAVSLEISEPSAKYCDDVSFGVTSFASDTLFIGTTGGSSYPLTETICF